MTEPQGGRVGKTIVSTTTDATTNEDCAAYCSIASTDCLLYHLDTANSKCYAGLLSHTAGNWPLSNEQVVTFHTGNGIFFLRL